MNSKSLRRLASEHAHLHSSGLPPNYLWPPNSSSTCCDDLTTLTVLLAGSEGTAFASGLFTLTLSIPSTYPTTPPTAAFKTKIFHPNVDPNSGSVCVDTLKRDWKPELKLWDVLVVISCLLISPNPASALNAEAGRLCEGEFGGFERRARMWVGIHARCPKELESAVMEARRRGEASDEQDSTDVNGVNTERRGRGKRRLAGPTSDEAENVRERKRRSRSTSPSTRGIGPLTNGTDNVLGISTSDDVDIGTTATTSQVESNDTKNASKLPAKPQMHHATPTMSPPTIPTPRPLKALLALQSIEYPTFSSVGDDPTSTFDYKISSRPAKHSDWLHFDVSNASETSSERSKRQKLEERRLEAAGGDLRKYNTGSFGVRTGLKRL